MKNIEKKLIEFATYWDESTEEDERSSCMGEILQVIDALRDKAEQQGAKEERERIEKISDKVVFGVHVLLSDLGVRDSVLESSLEELQGYFKKKD